MRLALRISRGVIGFAEEIIDAFVVESRKLDQNSGGNVIFARFVFGISGLRHPQHLSHLRLIQVSVLAQTPQACVHGSILPPINLFIV